MVFSSRPAALLFSGLLLAAPLILAQAGASFSPAAAPPALLPSSFAGWTAAAAPQTGADPTAADSLHVPVLQEYGLKEFAVAEYRRGAAKMNVKALRFVDATGAYGAFTFYRKPAMRTDQIGGDSAADSHEVVFWAGTTCVDAITDQVTPEERTALKTLAARMPKNAGPEGVPPTLPRYLPGPGLQLSTVHYAIGPQAYVTAGGVLPPEVIDFSRDAEAITAQYQSRDGSGTLTLLAYPTPQMAEGRAKAIDALLKGALPSPLQGGNAAALGVKATGTLVAFTSGGFSAKQAQRLLDSVKYQAVLTVNHTEAFTGEVRKTARLLLGIVTLTGILGLGALLLGIFLGGGRALIRVLRGKPPSTMNDDDFISLKLEG